MKQEINNSEMTVSSNGDILKRFLNTTLKEIMHVLEAECGSLFLFDGHNKELVLDSFYSGQLRIGELKQRIGQGVAGKVADIKMPVLVKDINLDQRFQRNGFKHYATNSFISIPITCSRGLIGVINIADKSNRKPFDEKDLNFAIFICKYASMAIDNLNNCHELKQEKEDLDKQKAALEKYASVGKLAAGVVHEINNPLDGIIRYTNLLLQQLDNNSIAREYLLEAKKGLNRIANITKSLLEFSRLANKNGQQVKKVADTHHLIDEALDLLSESFNDKIRINKNYADNLPKVLDFGLSHIFINLMKNSIDAMPLGGLLEITTSKKEAWIEINFKDSGSGVSEEIKEHIFEPFFTTKSIDKGTGLGLSICKEIINKYEGQIHVDNNSGEGCEFRVIIPAKYFENEQI